MDGILGTYRSYDIIINNNIIKPGLVQVRTHKKHRINKKWLKRYGMKHIQDDKKIIFYGNKAIMSMACYKKLKRIEQFIDERDIF